MHLAVPPKSFKPKASSGLSSSIQKNRKYVAIVAGLLFLYYVFLRDSSTSYFSLDKSKVPEARGLYKYEIPTTRTLIFPPVEHAPLLKQIGVGSLFATNERHELVYDQDEPKPLDKENKDKDQSLAVKDAFTQNGRLVFDHNNRRSPEIVIVSHIDFERYDLPHLTKVVQNRVDYAQSRRYGTYIRWTQEFEPLLREKQNDKSWVKLFVMRAALHAFPKSKYFWYIDQDAVIMKYDVDLMSQVLSSEKLNRLLLKDHPVVPPSGAIHTYKNVKAENMRFLVTQDERSINTDSFILVNDLYGRTLLDFWTDPLYRQYQSFPMKEASALMHILQWHPVILSKTGIIPSRTIASIHSVVEGDSENNDKIYKKGDLAVILKNCDIRKSCESEFESYWNQLHGK